MDWLEMVLPLISDAAVIVVLALVGFGITLFRKWMVEQWIKELVIDAVLFAQEKYWKLDGKERFEKVKKLLLEELNQRGIKITEEWLDALIDRMVKKLRAEFGEEDWYRNINREEIK